MTKQEFITALADKQNISKAKAGELLNGVKSILSAELSKGNSVTLGRDFGTFKPVTRSGKVPGTGADYTSNSVKFSISAPFKRELNK